MFRATLLALLVAALALVGSAPLTGAQSDQGQESSPSPDSTPIINTGEVPDATKGVQSNEDALAQDLALVAEAKRWTIEEAAADRRAADIVGGIAEQVAAERPNVFVGSVLSPEPGGAPALYIKGPADEFVRTLVTNAAIDVRIVDNQPFSFEDLKDRQREVARALEAQGFQNVYVGFGIEGAGQIKAAVTRQPGLPDDTVQILSGVPQPLRASVTLTVSDVPIAVDLSAFGGMQMRDDGANKCTSGWSVWNATGTTGVTTAGHCTGINEIVDPSVGMLALSHEGEHRGEWGDVEWKTSTQLELAKFYAHATSIRSVTAVEPVGSISQGESVCFYGRASNIRDCSLDVEDVSMVCINQNVWNANLVMMDGVGAATNGDSGGGWSWGNRAYGSTKGLCGPDDSDKVTFSVADLYDEALGVRVRVADTLPTGGVLRPGDYLTSIDKRFTAVMQTDGNFVLYRNSDAATLWASSWCGQTSFASNISASMQPDGNFALYQSGVTPARWATSWSQTQQGCPSNQQTVFGSGVYMVMQNDGNLVMYKPGYGAVWASNTWCGC